MMYGLGGPGSGYGGNMPQMPVNLAMQQWWELMKAGGFGAGPYGYALSYGLVPWGQQAMMLSRQWGPSGIGNHPVRGIGDHGLR